MSNVNIKRAVENIKSSTTVYTPIIEVIVNAIQAIESKNGDAQGQVKVIVKRSPERELDNSVPSVIGIDVIDNGIGFTDENRNSFDTLYSDLKAVQGGKGFGRFTCLKYFGGLQVESVFESSDQKMSRSFAMGTGQEIIVNEQTSISSHPFTFSKITLSSLIKNDSINKKLSTIAANLSEKLLPYFITKDYVCPQITLSEEDGAEAITLNDYVNDASGNIKELKLNENT
ncbi:MAG: ATP-binding protein, partial [Deltaproteobacteria bacterium HGW-Deltaproteobacteria-7]